MCVCAECTRFDNGMACAQDIAMNFLVRNATGEEPVLFSPGFFEKQRIELDDTGGLSISGDAWKWPEKRSQCVKWLMRHFE